MNGKKIKTDTKEDRERTKILIKEQIKENRKLVFL